MHTLTLTRRAGLYTDGHCGLLYFHHWPTGWQELVFCSELHADSFLRSMNGGAA